MKHLQYLLAAVVGIAVSVPLVSSLAFRGPSVPHESRKGDMQYYRQFQPRDLVTDQIRMRKVREEKNRMRQLEQRRAKEESKAEDALAPAAPDKKTMTTETGSKTTYWDLDLHRRLEVRTMIRRGGCPYSASQSIREICLEMLKRRPVQSKRPQQFYKGDFN